MNKRFLSSFLAMVMAAGLMAGCGSQSAAEPAPERQETAAAQTVGETVDLGGLLDEAVPLAAGPALSTVLNQSKATVNSLSGGEWQKQKSKVKAGLKKPACSCPA